PPWPSAFSYRHFQLVRVANPLAGPKCPKHLRALRARHRSGRAHAGSWEDGWSEPGRALSAHWLHCPAPRPADRPTTLSRSHDARDSDTRGHSYLRPRCVLEMTDRAWSDP